MDKYIIIEGSKRRLMPKEELDAKFAGGKKLFIWKILERLKTVKTGFTTMFSSIN